MDSLTSFTIGTKCSVIIEVNGKFHRRNGIVDGKVAHLDGVWCVAITNPSKGEPNFVRANENYYEILEPICQYESLIQAFDEVLNELSQC